MAKTTVLFFFMVYFKVIFAFRNDTCIEIITDNIKNEEEFLSISRCIVQLAKQDFSYKSTILIHHADENEITTLENELLDALAYELSLNNIPLITTQNFDIITTDDEYDGSLMCLIITEDCKEIEQLTFESKVTKYLFLISGDMKSCNETFDMVQEVLITNEITFAIMDSGNFTFNNVLFEIDEETCNITSKIKFIELNTCVGGLLKNHESIFPNKFLRNFKKCPLKTGLATLHPYMMMKDTKNNYTNLDPISVSDIHGADVEITKIISNYFNATLDLYFIFRHEENPFVNTEFIELVVNGSLDICAGGLYRIYGDVVDYGGVYSRQAVVWAYSVDREIRSWQSFIVKVNGLYMFFIFYIVYGIVWKLICISDKQAVSMKDTLLYSLGCLLGTTPLQDARSWKQKLVNTVYLIMALHISVYISVQLYSYLTIQGPPPHYKTIDDLISSGTKPYLKFETKYFVEDKKYETFANTSGACADFLDCERVIMKYKGTTILIDGLLPQMQAQTSVGDEARVVQVNEEILFVYHEMLVRKNSYISEPFGKAVMRLFEAGICQKLYDDAIGILDVDRSIIATKNIMSNSYSCQEGCEITLTQSAGAFYIWLIGCAFSFVVFVFEVLMRREIMTIIE